MGRDLFSQNLAKIFRTAPGMSSIYSSA